MIDNKGHPSIQPWSHGPLFPCVIVRVEYYPQGAEFCAQLVAGSTEWELRAYGRAVAYATRESAEKVARALNADERLRAQWRATDSGAHSVSVHVGAEYPEIRPGEVRAAREILGDFHGMPVYRDEQGE